MNHLSCQEQLQIDAKEALLSLNHYDMPLNDNWKSSNQPFPFTKNNKLNPKAKYNIPVRILIPLKKKRQVLKSPQLKVSYTYRKEPIALNYTLKERLSFANNKSRESKGKHERKNIYTHRNMDKDKSLGTFNQLFSTEQIIFPIKCRRNDKQNKNQRQSNARREAGSRSKLNIQRDTQREKRINLMKYWMKHRFQEGAISNLIGKIKKRNEALNSSIPL